MTLLFDSVSKRYGGRLIVKDIGMQLAGGEIVLLIGANGAGKSTILRLAAGLTGPTTGTVSHYDTTIGYLGHSTSIYPELSALDNLIFWQRLHKLHTGQDYLTEILDRVGLARRAYDRAGAFSRGMSQRLNLARLLAQTPDILLLDEPGTGLDATGVQLLTSEIRAARERGAGVLWVSHDVERDMRLADRVVALVARKNAKGKDRSGSCIGFVGKAAEYGCSANFIKGAEEQSC